ncbi:MAG: hypothetical protein LUI39_05335 [Lachnospiraceae bacterium]|nr:hypothetical protein [Lachnospiraceae bacterium]
MDKKISVKEMMDETRKMNTQIGDFALNCRMPLQYRPAMPLFGKCGGKVFLTIPFNYYKITGVSDKTEVYPVRYAVTITLPDKTPVKFEDLSMSETFQTADLTKPVGYFRHDSIKDLSAVEYRELEEELYMLYNKKIEKLLSGGEENPEEERKFSGILRRILPPSLYSQYRALDPDFYYTYLD